MGRRREGWDQFAKGFNSEERAKLIAIWWLSNPYSDFIAWACWFGLLRVSGKVELAIYIVE